MSAQPTREWSYSFFDCCDPFGLACLTCWCPCITYGKTHHRIAKDPSMAGYSAFNGSCCGFLALGYCGVSWVMAFMQRGEMRHKYGLGGDGCTDCLKACCCLCCDLMQQEKESAKLEVERNPMLGAQQPGKVEQGGMVYAQPGAAPAQPAQQY